MEIKNIQTIDAKGKRLGRVASEAAHVLMGKDDPSFVRNKVTSLGVSVTNAGLMLIDPKKIKQKEYTRYSGYPGGLKKELLEKVIKDKGVSEVLSRAIYGMLPSNKLRSQRMKLLSIHE